MITYIPHKTNNWPYKWHGLSRAKKKKWPQTDQFCDYFKKLPIFRKYSKLRCENEPLIKY